MDLRCWMALAARALATIGANLGLPPKGAPRSPVCMLTPVLHGTPPGTDAWMPQ